MENKKHQKVLKYEVIFEEAEKADILPMSPPCLVVFPKVILLKKQKKISPRPS